MHIVLVRIATERMTMSTRQTFAKCMGQKGANWFTPPSTMVLTQKIKSVWKYIRDGTTVLGGNIAIQQGQQDTILPAGVRATASTILRPKRLSQIEQQRGHCNPPCNGGIPVGDAGKVN
jgi:hypothetical protein